MNPPPLLGVMPSLLSNPALNHLNHLNHLQLNHLNHLHPHPLNPSLPFSLMLSLLPHLFLNPPVPPMALLELLLPHLNLHLPLKLGNGTDPLKNLALLHHLNLPPHPKVLSSKREVTLEESKRKFNMSFMSIA